MPGERAVTEDFILRILGYKMDAVLRLPNSGRALAEVKEYDSREGSDSVPQQTCNARGRLPWGKKETWRKNG